jgi:hypothetical protein
MLPGWLSKDPSTGKPVVIEHRAKVLNEIFDWYIDGKGLPWIERTLNERGEPSWGRGAQANKGWGVDRLHRYLTSRTVMGEFAPKSRNGKERVSRGFVVPDYFPQVISPDKFNRAQAVRQSRKGWGGRNQQSLPNLFSGIAYCRECGGRMGASSFAKAGQERTQKRRSGNGRRSFVEPKDKGYLVCRNARRALGCTNKTMVPYYPLEAGVLTYLWDFAMQGQFIKPDSKTAALTSAVAERERHIAVKREQIANLEANLTSVVSQTLTRKLVALEEEVAGDEQALEAVRRELQVELGKAPPKEDLEAVSAARSALQSDDTEARYAARTKTHQSLKRLINHMECQPDGTTLIVFGSYGAGVTFDRDGNRTNMTPLNARYEGPDGEPNWHPDGDTG